MSIIGVLARLLTAVAAVAACAMVTSGRDDLTPIDHSLPLVAALVVVAAWLAVRYESLVLVSVPLLVLVAVAIPNERARLFLYGLVLAGALLVALAGAGHAIESWRAIGLVLIITTILKAIPLTFSALLPLLLVFAGLTVLILVFGSQMVPLHVLPVSVAVALVTPLIPARGSLFPLVLGLMVAYVKTAAFPWLVAAAVLALPAGKWAVLLVAIAATSPLISRLRGLARFQVVMAPTFERSWMMAGRLVAFSPGTIIDAFSAPRGLTLTAMALLVVALIVRPALALIYLVCAVTFLLPATASKMRRLLAIPSAIFVMLWISFYAWSGALPPSFPLPFALSPPALNSQEIGRSLAAGESILIPAEGFASRLFLVVSGSNISAIKPGVRLGHVEFVDRSGRGYRRELHVGDIADWGAFRPAHFFGTRNVVPRNVTAMISGYGASAFLAGHSRIELTSDGPIVHIRLTALPDLPQEARLELHRLEWQEH